MIKALTTLLEVIALKYKRDLKYSDSIQLRQARDHVIKCNEEVRALRYKTGAANDGSLNFSLSMLAEAKDDYRNLVKKIKQNDK